MHRRLSGSARRRWPCRLPLPAFAKSRASSTGDVIGQRPAQPDASNRRIVNRTVEGAVGHALPLYRQNPAPDLQRSACRQTHNGFRRTLENRSSHGLSKAEPQGAPAAPSEGVKTKPICWVRPKSGDNRASRLWYVLSKNEHHASQEQGLSAGWRRVGDRKSRRSG
jgi:hypothetical protein